MSNHPRRSIRLPEYDYTARGAYFVTICTHARRCVLGQIVDGGVKLSMCGRIAKLQWEKLPVRFTTIELDAYCVMPNHIHGIIVINDLYRGTAEGLYDENCLLSRCAPTQKKFGNMVSGSIPTIVRSFKFAVTRRVNYRKGSSGAPFWQRNYYETVIRNQHQLDAVREYIRDNSINWELDKEYREG